MKWLISLIKLSKQIAILIYNLIYNEQRKKLVDSGDNKAADSLKEDEENKDEEKSKIARPELPFGGVRDRSWVSAETEKIHGDCSCCHYTQTIKPEMLRVLSNQMRYRRYQYFYPLYCSVVDFLQLVPDPE
jgi:hypothetical protein